MVSKVLYFNYPSSDKYLGRQLWKNVQVRCLSFLDGCRLYATIVKHNFSTVTAEYEHLWVMFVLFCCLFLILLFPPIYVLKSYTVPNIRFLIYKQGSTRVKMSCQKSLKQCNRGISWVPLSVDKFAVEICSGKMEQIFFC